MPTQDPSPSSQLAPPPASPALRFLYRAATALVFLAFAAACLHGIANYWQWGHDGFNGAAFTQAVRNSLRFGIAGQAQYWMELTPPPASILYTHHPQALHANLLLSALLFGVHEWSARLLPALYSLGALGLTFAIARRHFGRAAALVSATIYVLTPLPLIFANMVNHEQGGIFGCLLTVWATLRFHETHRTRHALLALAAITFAAGFDWPAYPLAFFLFLHALLLAVREGPPFDRSWLRRPTPRFAALFAVVVLLNFFGTFLWVLWVRGNLADMVSGFETRSAAPGDFLARLLSRALDLHGAIPLGLTLLWLGSALWRLRRGRLLWGELAPALFLIVQAIHSGVFRGAGYIHSYWTFYLVPASALAGGALTALFLRTSLARRLGGRALVAAGLLVVVLWTPWSFAQLRWGFDTGHASYVEPYDPFDVEHRFFEAVAARHPREAVTYQLHRSMDARIELTWYLDAPSAPVQTIPDRFLPSRVGPGPEHVLLADLEDLGLADRRRLKVLASRHPLSIYAGRFVAMELDRKIPPGAPAPSVTAFALQQDPAGFFYRWLVNPTLGPAHWVAASPASGVAALAAADDLVLETRIGPGGGHPFRFLCPKGAFLHELRGGEETLPGGRRTVGWLQLRCAPKDAGPERGLVSETASGFTSPRFGAQAPGASPFTLRCAPGERFTALTGRAGLGVDALGIVCSGARPGATTQAPANSGASPGAPPPTSPFRHACPRGSALAGLVGRSGALLDRVGVICRSL